jgi:hypothetical protein
MESHSRNTRHDVTGINTLDAARIVDYLPIDGRGMLESDWRRKARGSCRSATYASRVCNWLIECGAVEMRGELSVARGPSLTAVLDCARTIRAKYSPP